MFKNYILQIAFIISLAIFSAKAENMLDFTMSRKVAGVNVDIDFNAIIDTSQNVILMYEWKLSDGSEYSGMNSITHNFKSPGEYEALLIVTDLEGKKIKTSKKIKILPNEFPSADFFISNLDKTVGSEVAFISQAKDDDDNIEKYEWQINTKPGIKGSGKVFTYIFSKPGTYKIRHKVTDNLGAKAENEKEIEVLNPNKEPRLEVDFPRLVNTGELQNISLKAFDEDGKIVSLSWKLDGGAEVPFGGNSFNVIFPKNKSYTLTVKAIDDRGGVTVKKSTISALNPNKLPKVKLITSSDKVIVGKTLGLWIDFTSGSNQLEEIQWDFGDGTSFISNKMETDHIYNSPGKYKLKVKVIAVKGKSVELEQEITVLGSVSAFTTPTQVVLDSLNYLEVIPNQTFTLSFSAYANNTKIYAYSIPAWSISNGNIQLISTTSSSATFKGLTPGQTTISVSIDGVTSQNITINVIGFSGDAVVTQKGRFLGSNFANLCMFINRSPGVSYDFIHNFMDLPTYSSAYSSSSNKISTCLFAHIPQNVDNLLFSSVKSSDQSDPLFYNKTIKSFNGRNGFLYFTYNTKIRINYTDSRIVNFSDDFSITYWTLRGERLGNSVYQVLPSITGGSFSLQQYGDAIVVSGNGTSNYLYLPTGSDFKKKWTHIGLAYESSGRILKLYVDGEYVSSVQVPTATIGQTGVLEIGSNATGSGTTLDELRFWNKALSASEMYSELFSPMSEDSQYLMASFNFDNSLENGGFSNNGSQWNYTINDLIYSPQTRNAPINLMEQVISAQAPFKFTSALPFGEYLGKNISLTYDVGSFLQNKKVYLEAGTCQFNCSYESTPSTLKFKRVSPYFYVSALRNLQTNMVLRIPFDVQSVSAADIKKIKVIQFLLDGENINYLVLEPGEVNVVEGYISVDLLVGGTFFVSVYDSTQPRFTNSDLYPTLGGQEGFRNFYLTVPNSQTTYVANAEVGSFSGYSYISTSCSAASMTATISGNDLTFSNIPSGTNYCFVNYEKNESGYSYFLIDKFFISKGL